MIGGGPSGVAAARLLASWGHDVRLLTRPIDPARALANSLPPSSSKLLSQVGLADLVDQVGFRTSGNTVWWGDREGQVERFSRDDTAWGHQIDRAVLDPLLLDAASRSGVRVESDARVHRVDLQDGRPRVTYETGGCAQACPARLVLDCSGRAGAVAVSHSLRRQVPGGRMQALVGVWRRPGPWLLQNRSHTFIETCDDGWAWSLPTSEAIRHVGVMVDGATSSLTRGPTLEATYRAQLELTTRIDQQVRGASLDRVFACDATIYTASSHAGPGYLLVGDAGSTLNPLSSFGVKKALASAWLASVVANTCLTRPELTQDAQAFFSRWEAEIWQMNLMRSRDFAREALATHHSAFWATQAAAPIDESAVPLDDAALLTAPDVMRELERLRQSDSVVISRSPKRTIVSAPIVRGNVINNEEAIVLGERPRDVLRYARGIDLVALATIAPLHSAVPAIYEDYCAKLGQAPLPALLATLSLLIARGVLHADLQGARAHSSS